MPSAFPLPDGTVYSQRMGFCPFSSPPLASYLPIIGDEKMERLYKAAQKISGLRLLELNATAQGGGVAEMLFSVVPFLNSLGIDTEWKVIHGTKEYFECTKNMHNLLQGMEGTFTDEMEQTYLSNLEKCALPGLIDDRADIVTVHDPQPLCLTHYLRKPQGIWLWRCHIDCEESAVKINPKLMDLVCDCVEHYDAAIFSAAHYVMSQWPLPKFLIPPFIDPLSEKNRDLSEREIAQVLNKYGIDSRVPTITQVGRFDPWKGIDRTIAVYRKVREEKQCQLIIAGGMAADDPEGQRILDKILAETKGDENIHVLNLPMNDRIVNWKEINALQSAATVIMQPSTREGFGLVITEALWKGKPVIASNVGGIPLQLRDGYTGYFYQTPARTARRVIQLMDNPDVAESLGKKGKAYVRDHFLLPDRITDYLMTIYMTRNIVQHKDFPKDAIISFHPWYKLAKRY